MVDKIDAKAHDLAPLGVGDRVKVQNQAGTAKTRWSRTGTVMEVNNEYDQYLVLMDGSRRTTARNRKFLRKIRDNGPGPGRQDSGAVAPSRPPPPGPVGQKSGQNTAAGTPPGSQTKVPDRAVTTPRPEVHTPAGRADQTTPRRTAGILLRNSAARRVTFEDELDNGRGA